MIAPWSVADLALDVPKGLFRGAHSIAVTRTVSNDVAGNASRLEVPMPIQKCLERRGVLSALPLRVLRFVTSAASGCAHVHALQSGRIPREGRGNTPLGR